MRSPIASNVSYLEEILALSYTWSVGGTHPEQDYNLEDFAETGWREKIRDGKGKWGKSELLIRFYAFHKPTNTTLGCQPISSGGVLATMRSNHICFWVTSTEPFITACIDFELFNFPFCLRSFPQPVTGLEICQFPPDQQWIAHHHKYLLPQLDSTWISMFCTTITDKLYTILQTNTLIQPAYSGLPCTHVVVLKHLTCRPPVPRNRSIDNPGFPL